MYAKVEERQLHTSIRCSVFEGIVPLLMHPVWMRVVRRHDEACAASSIATVVFTGWWAGDVNGATSNQHRCTNKRANGNGNCESAKISTARVPAPNTPASQSANFINSSPNNEQIAQKITFIYSDLKIKTTKYLTQTSTCSHQELDTGSETRLRPRHRERESSATW